MFYQNESVSDACQGMPSVVNICAGHWNEGNQNYNWTQNPLSSDCEIPIRNPAPYVWQNHAHMSLTFEDPEKYSIYQQKPVASNHSEAPLIVTPILEQQHAFGTYPLFENSSAPFISEFDRPQFQPQLQHKSVITNEFFPPKQHHPNSTMARNHHAHMKLISTSSGNLKTIVKRKRKRTIFSTEQIAALEEVFARKSYVTREERHILVNQLHISDKSVKVWFQNRRLKSKRGQDSTNSDSQTEDRSSPDIARLDYVESQINKKTDEFGFVTLDDAAMSDLVNVIDNFLSKSNELDESTQKVKIERESRPIYEPISPASLTDCTNEDENLHRWEPFEPKESLQKLFDLQSMFSNYQRLS